MGRHGGCYFISMAGAFSLGVLLACSCSLKLALFVSAFLLCLVCFKVLRWQ